MKKLVILFNLSNKLSVLTEASQTGDTDDIYNSRNLCGALNRIRGYADSISTIVEIYVGL